ncbi:MAG: hypothetical protein D6815_05050 [Candidatus Dadabacteria bacterium]|nr:MAG: hypothetical protein D6815_05050 [Candidatus Dadabacteria bacterium]
MEFVLREHAPADLNGNLRLASVGLVAPSGIRISAQAATVRLSGRQIELPETQAHVAGRPVRLEATIGDYATKTLEFTVRAPEIDSRDLGLSPADRRPPVALTDLETVGIVHLARNDDPIWIRAHLSAGSGTVASVPVKAVRAVIRLEEERLVFSPLALELLDGSLVVEGAYHRSPGGQPGFNLKGHASGIDLEKFAEAIGATKRLDGRLSGEVTLAGPAVEWSKMRDKLVGGGSVTIRDGTLHGVNIVSSVLRGIGKLPGLSLVLSAPVLNKYPALIPGGKTVFRELRSRFTVAEGAILSDEIVVAGSDFNIAGRGTVGLDGSTDVRAVFEASVPLTSDLVDAVAPLRLLVGGTQRISVPFRLRGRAPKLSVKLDPAYLGKHLGRGIVDLVTGRRLIDALTGAASPGGGAAPASPEGARPADSRPVPPGRPVLPGSATTTQERGQTEPAPAREPAAPAGPGQAEPTPDR